MAHLRSLQAEDSLPLRWGECCATAHHKTTCMLPTTVTRKNLASGNNSGHASHQRTQKASLNQFKTLKEMSRRSHPKITVDRTSGPLAAAADRTEEPRRRKRKKAAERRERD